MTNSLSVPEQRLQNPELADFAGKTPEKNQAPGRVQTPGQERI